MKLLWLERDNAKLQINIMSLWGRASKGRVAFSSETTGKKEKEINGMKLLANREVEGRDLTASLLLFLK